LLSRCRHIDYYEIVQFKHLRSVSYRTCWFYRKTNQFISDLDPRFELATPIIWSNRLILENRYGSDNNATTIRVGSNLTKHFTFGSLIIILINKVGTLRMCINYTTLNKIIVKNRYHLPRVDDLLDQLYHANYFTKLDLISKYHQVQVKKEDTWKTAFKTRQCLYEWLVMPFVLCNALFTFMCLMKDVSCPFLDSFVLMYLDDILVYNFAWVEHISHLL
jgi:hypothetical protein